MFVLPWRNNKNTREFIMPEGLSKKQQEEVKEIIKNAQKSDGTPRTAQQTIPLERMFPDGICRVWRTNASSITLPSISAIGIAWAVVMDSMRSSGFTVPILRGVL